MTDRAPHDAAQHVAAPLVRRRHAVGDAGTRWRARDRRARASTRRRRRRCARTSSSPARRAIEHERLQADRCRSSTSRPARRRSRARGPRRCRSTASAAASAAPSLVAFWNCMNTRFQISTQPIACRRRLLVELAESALPSRPDVIVDLRARPLRPGVAHHPEVVLQPEPHDALVAEARRPSATARAPRRRPAPTPPSPSNTRDDHALRDRARAPWSATPTRTRSRRP